jgi:hypothetical protein
MNNSDGDHNAVKDAARIMHALNKHLIENCEHCMHLSTFAFRNEDDIATKGGIGAHPKTQDANQNPRENEEILTNG